MKYLLLSIYFFTSTIVSFSQSANKPNIIVILADDLGYGDIGCLGAKDVKTPAIDFIATNGMSFNNFYANSTVCSPTRASLLTGKYPDAVGVPGVIRQDPTDNWGNLLHGAELLPSVLKKNGYHTAMVGKWHLGYSNPNLPNAKGFDYFKGFLGDMMDDYYTHRRDGINWMRFNEAIIDPPGHATDIFTAWSIEYVKNKKTTKEPFFLFLSYNAPHFPIQPPLEIFDRVKKRFPNTDEKRVRNIALVEYLDASIGKLLAALKQNGQLENTLILFTSDNGGSLPHAQSNGKLNGGKQDMFEGGIKVPLFVYWNKHVLKGSSSERLTMTMDLFPTICDAAAIDYPDALDGKSFFSSLKGGEIKDDRTLFWVRKEGGLYRGQSYYAARKGRFKILQNHPDEKFALYDLYSDPYEKNPLDTSKQIFNELKQALAHHISIADNISQQSSPAANAYSWDHGGIVRGDSAVKKIAWVFTGDEYFEGLGRITEMLSSAKAKGSFFLTGRLYRNPLAKSGILRLLADGHYMGPHSDAHLLYNDWSKRDSNLVAKDSMLNDLRSNYKAMKELGIQEKQLYFIPPYEWWNRQVASWCKELNVQVINFTPGTGTNADYTYPEMALAYRSSANLQKRLFAFEHDRSLNGAILLIHIGTDARRTDKLYEKLPEMMKYFQSKGYSFVRIDQLLSK
jgi:hypothetical protein